MRRLHAAGRTPQAVPGQGQVMLEVAIAAIGVIMFIYVFTRVWTWFSGTIVQRQEAFQASRLAAGQVETPGQPVGYVPPPIRLVGAADSVGGDGDSEFEVTIGEPPCEAAKPFYEQAKTLLDEAEDLKAQAAAITDQITDLVNNQINPLAAQIQALADAMAGEDDEDDLQNMANQMQALAAQMDALRAQMQALQDQANDLLQQSRDKMAQATQLIQQGQEACDT